MNNGSNPKGHSTLGDLKKGDSQTQSLGDFGLNPTNFGLLTLQGLWWLAVSVSVAILASIYLVGPFLANAGYDVPGFVTFLFTVFGIQMLMRATSTRRFVSLNTGKGIGK